MIKSNIFKNILLLFLTLSLCYIIGEFSTDYYVFKQTGYVTKDIEYNINSEGFRDSEHEIKKPSGTIRILILGDSFTAGGIIEDYEHIYPVILERLLNEKNKDYSYEIINFGKGGSNLSSKLNEFNEKGQKYKPDIVILQHRLWMGDEESLKRQGIFDNLDVKANKYDLEFIRLLNQKTRYILFKKELAKGWEGYSSVMYGPESENTKLLKKQFQELKNTSENEFKVLCVNFNWFTIDKEFSNYAEKYSYGFIKNVCEENDFLFLDLYEFYKTYNLKKLRVNIFDGHPNEKAHEIAAKAIYSFLIQERLIPDAENRTILI